MAYVHPTDNWKHLVDVVEVTFTSQLPSASPIAGVKAKQRPLNGKELNWATSVGLDTETVVWVLWSDRLGATIPKLLDEITDAGGAVWIVQKLTRLTFGSRWRAVCNRKG